MVNPRERRLILLLPLAVAGLAAAFVAATAVAQYRAHDIEEDARLIYGSALPAIDHLSHARTAVREMEERLSHALTSQTPDLARDMEQLTEARRQLAGEWRAYLALKHFVGAEQLAAHLSSLQEQVAQSVDGVLSALGKGALDTARASYEEETEGLLSRLDDELLAAAELNGKEAIALGEEISRSTASARQVAIALDALCAALAVVVAVVVVRSTRSHLAVLSERMTELELFSSRVAHDISSPLASVGLAIEIIRKGPQEPAKVQRTLDRAGQAVRRMGELVEGLLMLARAGSAPDVARHCRPREVVDQVVSELSAAAESKEIQLSVECVANREVACTAGVLSSMLANLVGNALKYMGNALVRRVTVRVLDAGACVRFEVEDTGPGVPASRKDRIFEPYVRAADASIPGLGMGLATVRKLSEAHGGRVGLESLSSGSKFWFELPAYDRSLAETSPQVNFSRVPGRELDGSGNPRDKARAWENSST